MAIDAQFVASVLAWTAAAWVVGRSLRAGWPRWLGSGLVLGFALTGPVTLWDRQVLTESLSLSAPPEPVLPWSLVVMLTVAAPL